MTYRIVNLLRPRCAQRRRRGWRETRGRERSRLLRPASVPRYLVASLLRFAASLYCSIGRNLATHTAKPSRGTGSMPAACRVSRTKRWRSLSPSGLLHCAQHRRFVLAILIPRGKPLRVAFLAVRRPFLFCKSLGSYLEPALLSGSCHTERADVRNGTARKSNEKAPGFPEASSAGFRDGEYGVFRPRKN